MFTLWKWIIFICMFTVFFICVFYKIFLDATIVHFYIFGNCLTDFSLFFCVFISFFNVCASHLCFYFFCFLINCGFYLCLLFCGLYYLWFLCSVPFLHTFLFVFGVLRFQLKWVWGVDDARISGSTEEIWTFFGVWCQKWNLIFIINSRFFISRDYKRRRGDSVCSDHWRPPSEHQLLGRLSSVQAMMELKVLHVVCGTSVGFAG